MHGSPIERFNKLSIAYKLPLFAPLSLQRTYFIIAFYINYIAFLLFI